MKTINHARFLFFGLFIFVMSMVSNAQKIKVACVGNSVTYGAGIEDRTQHAYPAQLQQLLGGQYQVENFGYSGATMLKNGHKPYWDRVEFEKSKEFAPNIVIIHLGLNDQGLNNWPEYKNEFEPDYIQMIQVYKNLPSNPKVMICKMSPTFSGHHWFEEGMRESYKEIQYEIEKIAASTGVLLIDLHEKLYLFPEYFPDNLHPTKEGAFIIAKQAYSAITGDYGGLKLPALYGEKMVIQRNEPIVISGISDANDRINVVLNKEKIEVIVGSDGNWKVNFTPMNAGGPHTLTIKSTLSESITINEVFIGEVWLASGQSNMDFKLRDSKLADAVFKDSINPNVFIFSLDPKILKSGKFTEEDLALCNANDYFKPSGWTNNNREIIENFSAIAYAFAYNLQKELNIPIGIVCNAVGGSPTQSWISKDAMEQQHQTIDLLNDTWRNPYTDRWVAQRKVDNFGEKNGPSTPARHPYDPTFLFEAGIYPINDYTIKGVIWYQGESNVEHVDLHSKLFQMLVKDWRTQFKNPDMQFYYVQLSSIDRPNWGCFRDSQRNLLSQIPNTGMAVSSDVGNRSDVHPIKKWVVGERLSKIALANTYGRKIPFSGPLLDYINVNKNKLEVHFKYGQGLKTSNGEKILDIQIAGEDKDFVEAKTNIIGEVLQVWSPEILNPRYVRYGYSSFTEGNLINNNYLPASTFSNLFN